MNSSYLKKKFFGAYQEFFGSHDIVFSIPLSYPLWDD